MELGLLHDFFGNFSMRGERYYFGWRGAPEVRICMGGENVYSRWARGDFEWWRGHARWECVHEVRMCMRGDFEWWRGAREVRICMQGENVYVRWEYACEVTLRGGGDNSTQGAQSHLAWSHEVRIATWGGNGHARWELPHEVGMVMWGENCHARSEWSRDVRIAMQGENCHVRWEWSREVRIAMRGGNGHVRWELPREVGMVTWGENCHARWEWPPSEILHSLIFFIFPRICTFRQCKPLNIAATSWDQDRRLIQSE